MNTEKFSHNKNGVINPSLTTDIESVKGSIQKQIQECNNDGQKNFDVIVLGVGSMGSSTCYYLAKQGVKVLGLEQFDIPNELSSHTGQSRLIRKAYSEHSDYVPLLERSYENWNHLESMTGAQVYFKTGLFYFGTPDHLLMKGVHEAATKYDIKLESLSTDELNQKYPQIQIPAHYEKLLEPEAGFLTPEKAIVLYTDMALKYGANIKTNVKIEKWNKVNGGIQVVTSTGNYFAKKIIITSGPWAGKFINGLSSSLSVTKQTLAWVIPKNNAAYELGNLPCWTIIDETKPGVFYGFPVLPAGNFDGPKGFKLAHHFQGAVTNPDNSNRTPAAEDEINLIETLNRFFPEGYKSTYTMKTCMYTNTPDEDFILDFLPNYDNEVIVAAGFSGHGFKFASVVGEILSDLATIGKTVLPIGFLNAKRFYSKAV